MSNIVFLAERWPFAWPPTRRSPHNLMKNKYLLITWRFLPPRLKARIRRSHSGTLWVGSTYPPSRRVSRSLDPKAQKPAAPALTKEIHASTEVTSCFWSWPHSFLRCFPPDGSRILSCDRTIPLMYVPNEHRGNLRGGYWSWPTETALWSFECRGERAFRPRNGASRSSTLRLPLATVFSFTS